MEIKSLRLLAEDIVKKAQELSIKHTDQKDAPVNYACIFTHSDKEFEESVGLCGQIGRVVKNTDMGPVFLIEPISTDAGDLRLLKIRKPDPNRPERGDADFTVKDYEVFRTKYLNQPGFSLIVRPEM